jgi:hypothetical protein
MTMTPEQVKAKTYLLEKGTQAPVAQIRERVAEAFAAMDTLLEGVTEAQEMRALLENRHSPVSPIPAGLQSAAPMARRWDDLRAGLRRIHAEVLAVLAAAPDRPTEARAPVIMVINTRDADGRVTPLHWNEACDWKACAVIFRLHELDHLSQTRKVLRAT